MLCNGAVAVTTQLGRVPFITHSAAQLPLARPCPMRRVTHLLCLTGLSATLLAAAPPPAAPSADPLAGLATCRAIKDDAQRLSCYDRASGSLLAARSSGQVQVVDQGSLKEVRRNLFGFALPKLPFFRGDTSQDSAPDEITSQIVSARGLGYGKYRVTIKDGNAVWETSDTYENLDPPSAGQTVVIRKGSLGSYVLRFNGQRGVRGKRVG